MKKCFLLLVVMILAAQVVVRGENVTVEQARNIVLKFNADGHGKKRVAGSTESMKLVHEALPQNFLLEGEEPFYIFNAENAFYVVSAETEYGGILAYSDEGTLDTGNLAPTARYFFDFYKTQIELVRQCRMTASAVAPMSLGSEKLLKTANFGQNGQFWWNDCPQINGSYCYAGCGATAMAIVMKYYGWPKTGEGESSVMVNGKKYSVDFTAQNYLWNTIPTYSPYTTQWSQSAQDEGAKVLYHCGVAAKSDYGTDGTSTSILNISSALVDNFKYVVSKNKMGLGLNFEMRSLYSYIEFVELLKTEIDNNRPCILLGESYSTHIFVCDGYNASGMLHFNLGWNGTSNGYYSINSVGDKYSVTMAIVGIEPDSSKGYIPGVDNGDEEDGGNKDEDGELGEDSFIDGHEYVDLGLPSEKLWATSNYGANSPTGYGTFMEWSSISNVPASWGNHWTVPSYEDSKELVTMCSWLKTTKDGVEGYVVTGPNGNSLFLPFSGWSVLGSPNQIGEVACYWTSTEARDGFAYCIYSWDGPVEYSGYYNINMVMSSVRPISTLRSSDLNLIVEEVRQDPLGVSEIYSVGGKRHRNLQSGINIIRNSNGKSRKVLRK